MGNTGKTKIAYHSDGLGQRLTEAREKKGLSGRALARLLKIADMSIHRWENRIAFPNARMIERLANALDVPATWLLMGDVCVCHRQNRKSAT